MSKYIWLLDNGHGDKTPGKRSPLWPDGKQLFEYEFNRSIVNGLILKLKEAGIDYRNIVPEMNDISLPNRVSRANKIHAENGKRGRYVSIHANAGGGTGFEIFTSKGQTASDPMATVFIEEYAKVLPELKLRANTSDGDKDKEENFYVIKHTNCPAILVECAFMDTRVPDCDLLMSADGRSRMIKALFNAIVRLEN